MALLKILLFIFIGVALMVVILERTGKPMSEESMSKVSRWILPLLVVAVILQIVMYLL